MSRTRNDFLESMAPLTSRSSGASVKLYEERLKPGIENVRRSSTALHELVDAAEKIINEKFARDPQSTYTNKKDFSEEISVELD